MDERTVKSLAVELDNTLGYISDRAEVFEMQSGTTIIALEEFQKLHDLCIDLIDEITGDDNGK